MGEIKQRAAANRTRLGPDLVAVLLILAACLVAFHHHTFFSKFQSIEGGGDSMLNNFTLEHEWLWTLRQPTHRNLWSPPIFYPEPETAAFTDLLLGVFPAYASWRAAGADPQTAFQLWMLTISVLNFIAVFLFFRVVMQLSAAGSSAGAILFSFGSPRLMQIGHPQLLPGFYIVAIFAGLCLLFRQQPEILAPRRVYFGLLLAGAGLIGQFYTAFYYFWFAIFCGASALATVFIVRPWRQRLISFLRTWWRPAGVALFLCCLLLAPGAAVYLDIRRKLGPRSYDEVHHFLPSAMSWLAQGPQHLIYGALNRWAGIDRNFGAQEMFNGIGLGTTFIVLAAFVVFRRRPIIRIWAVIAAAVLISTYRWPGGFSLWKIVYVFFPGASAIRAVSRFGIFLLLPAAMAVAMFLDWAASRFSRRMALALLIVVAGEQFGSVAAMSVYPKSEIPAAVSAIQSELAPDCKTFLVSLPERETSVPIMHLFGMWTELSVNIPTLNGYSGQFPLAWPLNDVAVSDEASRARLLSGIQQWMNRNRSQIANVCWVAPGLRKAIIIRAPAEAIVIRAPSEVIAIRAPVER